MSVLATLLGLAQTIHVIVDRPIPVESLPWWQQERFWVACGSVTSLVVVAVTGVMAYFTRALAMDTKKLAEETRDVVRGAQAESEQRERHHQDSLAPLISTRGLTTLVKAEAVGKTLIYKVALSGKIVNFGPGPAAEVSGWFEPFGTPRQHFTAAPIGANAEIALAIEYVVGETFAGAANVGSKWPFHYAIRYVSMFGDEGWLVLYSASGHDKDVRVLAGRTASSGPKPQTLGDVMNQSGM